MNGWTREHSGTALFALVGHLHFDLEAVITFQECFCCFEECLIEVGDLEVGLMILLLVSRRRYFGEWNFLADAFQLLSIGQA